MFVPLDMALNQWLGALLTSAGAVYEMRGKTFTLAGESASNLLEIANACPLGTLTSFNQDDGVVPIKK